MEKLTVEQVKEQEGFVFNGEGKKSKNEEIFNTLKMMKVGEGLKINKEEWIGKTQPLQLVNSHFRQKKMSETFSVRRLKDGSGWVVIRTK